MSSRIIYTRLDGGLSIVAPTGEVNIDQVIAKVVPETASNVQIIDASAIPADRYFRNAWKQDGTQINVDMEKAQEVHMDVIRSARNKKLKELDVQLMIATEQQRSEDAAAIVAEKQRLRDLPDTFDLSGAATPETLKELWPENL